MSTSAWAPSGTYNTRNRVTDPVDQVIIGWTGTASEGAIRVGTGGTRVTSAVIDCALVDVLVTERTCPSIGTVTISAGVIFTVDAVQHTLAECFRVRGPFYALHRAL